MIIKNIDARLTLDGECELLLTLPKSENKSVQNLINDFKAKADKEWQAEISVKKKKRSLDANAYLWVMCDKVAEKLQTTKELIYQDAIKQVGVFDILLLQDKAVESFVNMWNRQGVGNYAEALYQSKAVKDCTTVRAYHGSHLYDTKQMSRLVDYIVQIALDNDIETMTPADVERLKQLWGK